MSTAITTPSPPAESVGAVDSTTTRRDRVAQTILGLCAAGALVATAVTAADVADADGALRTAETWRLFGLPVFAGLFLILATHLRQMKGVWELVIANKLALAVAGATFVSGADGGSDFVYVDGVLAVLLVAAYTLSQGWTAWSDR